MAIENLMVDSGLVSYHAVCCTEVLTVESINRFFAEVQHREHEENATSVFTLVHDLEERARSPTREIRSDEATFRSPFVNCDFPRIRAILKQMNTPRLHTDWFLVLDGESDKTSTAVIVRAEDDDDEEDGLSVTSARVAYGPASRYLSAASIGHPPLDELIEVARDSRDGVVRDD